MPSMTTNVPMRTGTRSKDDPCSAASPSPTTARSERLTVAATSVPAMAQTASVLSAPKRRNQRNPYTEATALPTGNELVMAWELNDSLTSGVHGARRCPALRSSYCMAAKHR